MKEYIVTLWNHEDLNSFYHEMENSGNCDCLPERCVECINRREISRNTHYFLDDEEAASLANDERVRSVSLTPEALGAKAVPISSTSNVDPSYIFGESNWGLRTAINGSNADCYKLNYRSGAYNYRTTNFWVDQQVLGSYSSVQSTSISEIDANKGKDVDVVIVDGDIDPYHIEFKKHTSSVRSDVERLPEKIIVSGTLFPTGRVLNRYFNRFGQTSPLTHFYSDTEDTPIGEMVSLYCSQLSSTNITLSLKTGFFSPMATKTMPKPSILDSGYQYNFEYSCIDYSQYNYAPITFDSSEYSNDGVMSNGYKIIPYRDDSTQHEIIPIQSDVQTVSNEEYQNIYFVKNRPLDVYYILNSWAGGDKRFIAPDIVDISEVSTSFRPSLYLKESIYNTVFDLTSVATGTTSVVAGPSSRVTQRAWWPGYSYNPQNSSQSNHGMHVASIACGNSQGLASESNIYNINPYENNTNLIFDSIREFHNSKPINTETNRKNPTVINNSWIYSYTPPTIENLTGITSEFSEKYSNTHSPIGDEIQLPYSLKVSGKINDAKYIDGVFDSTRLIIGGAFTGVELNGESYDISNLFALDLYNNTILKDPFNSNDLFFGKGVDGPVETIGVNTTFRGYYTTNTSPASLGKILVGGEFSNFINKNGSLSPVSNLIAFDLTYGGVSDINNPLFQTLNGKVKKISSNSNTENSNYGITYSILGDFNQYNGSTQNNILITDSSFNKTGFLGNSTFDLPPLYNLGNAVINDFSQLQGTDSFTMEHSMVIVGDFNQVGEYSCQNICAIDATGGVVVEFLENFSGTNGEIHSIIDQGYEGKKTQYIALGSFTSGNNINSPYSCRYNLRTGAPDQNQNFTVNGPVTKMEIDPYNDVYYHLYGNFTQVNEKDINNGLPCSYCYVERLAWHTDGVPGIQNAWRLEPVKNQKTLIGLGNVDFGITVDGVKGNIKNKSQGEGAGSFKSKRPPIYILGENLPGHDKSLVGLISTFNDIDLLKDFGQQEQFAGYQFNITLDSVNSDMEDCIEDGIVIINAAGNDNKLLVPSGHINYAKVIGSIPTNDSFPFTGSTPLYSNLEFNSAGSPQSVGINVGSLAASRQETGQINRSFFSNYGPQVHVYAPGENIIGAVNSGGGTFKVFDSYYAKYNGTSMASPQVCGIAALYLEKYPNLKHEDISNIMQSRSERDEMYDPDPNKEDYPNVPLNNVNLYDSNKFIPKYWDYKKLNSFYKMVYPQRVSPERTPKGVLYPKSKNRFL
jgi:hypothetical protein